MSARLHTGAPGGWSPLAAHAPGADRCGARPVRRASGDLLARRRRRGPEGLSLDPPCEVGVGRFGGGRGFGWLRAWVWCRSRWVRLVLVGWLGGWVWVAAGRGVW